VSDTPKLGLALSGAAARSVFYVGFLEVLREQGVRVDVIAAQSGASLAAASFACNTLDRFKGDVLTLNWIKVKRLLERSVRGGGWYNLDRYEEHVRHFYTQSKQFEDVFPKLCFVATNLNTGELVPLVSGDIAHAIRTTCTVPGIFEPVQWGNHLLVDGGVLSVIPSKLVREAGADIVVGVSVRATKHIFLPSQIRWKARYNYVKRMFVTGVVRPVFGGTRASVRWENFAAYFEDLQLLKKRRSMSMLKVVNRSLDLAVEATESDKFDDGTSSCDLLIQEGDGEFGASVNIRNMKDLYEQGRQAALRNIGRIQGLLAARAKAQ
jgi:NTE family protein